MLCHLMSSISKLYVHNTVNEMLHPSIFSLLFPCWVMGVGRSPYQHSSSEIHLGYVLTHSMINHLIILLLLGKLCVSEKMPRSSNKLQAEKREQKSNAKVTTEPKVAAEKSVLGGSTKVLWNDMLGHEEADETVGQFMEELDNIMKGCLSASVEQQVEQECI